MEATQTRAIRVGKAPLRTTAEAFLVNSLSSPKEITPIPHLYGASAAWCPRQNFFLTKDWDFGSTDSPSSNLYMSIGNGIEDAICDGLTRKGRLLFNNLYLPPMDPKVSGKIDIVYIDQDDQIAIGEIKSCGTLPSKPKESHLTQLLTYAAVGGYDRCNLIYVSRNVADQHGNILLRVFNIKIDDDTMLDILERVCLSQKVRDENWMPNPPATFTKATCFYCQFKDVCWGDKQHLLRQFETLSSADYAQKLLEVKSQALHLLESRRARNIASLRHLYRNTENRYHQAALIKEIEKTEPF